MTSSGQVISAATIPPGVDPVDAIHINAADIVVFTVKLKITLLKFKHTHQSKTIVAGRHRADLLT